MASLKDINRSMKNSLFSLCVHFLLFDPFDKRERENGRTGRSRRQGERERERQSNNWLIVIISFIIIIIIVSAPHESSTLMNREWRSSMGDESDLFGRCSSLSARHSDNNITILIKALLSFRLSQSKQMPFILTSHEEMLLFSQAKS
jgi:hypothetical protein